MDFEKMNDLIIAERLLNVRQNLNMTQEQFCEYFDNKVSIDKYRLSNLENGKRSKKKTPHFLTESYIEFYSSILNVSKEELLFGNIESKKELIKLILLSVFMNANSQSYRTDIPQTEQSPFFDLAFDSDEEFFRLAMSNLHNEEYKEYREIANQCLVDVAIRRRNNFSDIKKYREEIAIILEGFDSFFYSKKFANLYKLSMDGQEIFSEQSSILLRCLFGNFDFASDFLKRRNNYETIRCSGIDLRKPRVKCFYIDNYLNNLGNFSASAVQWKETSYQFFITAFNEFMELHFEMFINFFNKHIFSKTLKELSNKYVNNIFSCEEFTKLLNEVYLKDQFLMQRMVGHNFARAMIQKFALVRNNSAKLQKVGMSYPSEVNLEDFYNLESLESQREEYNLDKYLYDFENMTVLFANKGQKYKSGGLFLPSYFDISSLK
ncbi:helix-turn-helix domain-containing protein [Streptococcus anginosus]|uniref:helix-turn-helix domain-containing protein n=1 Tax=Streptococcus anginosus TaxID=1328 RepID=UPI00398D5DC5